MARIAWVTCRTIPEPDLDEVPTLSALRAAGMEAEKLAWDDPGATVSGAFEAAILRSCWNYYEDPEGFLLWLAGLSERMPVWNPVDVVRWNHHKRYLSELEARGVDIIPTEFISRGQSANLNEVCRRRQWDRIVIKPAISAGSYLTRRFEASEFEAASQFLTETLVDRDMLVQVFVPSVATQGERAVIQIDGRFTHAVVKAARYSHEDESVSEAREVAAEERSIAEAALAAAREAGNFSTDRLLYARTDLVEWDGKSVVSELELLEPSLFLDRHTGAMEQFVDAVKRRL